VSGQLLEDAVQGRDGGLRDELVLRREMLVEPAVGQPGGLIRSASPVATIPFSRNSRAAARTMRLRVSAASSLDFLISHVLRQRKLFRFHLTSNLYAPRTWMSGDILSHLQGDCQMSSGKILITGATGDTGGYAIEQLLQKGHEVRALVHRPDDRSKRLEDNGVEVVAGDYLDLDAMRTAVKGASLAYFVYPIRPGIIQATAYFAQAAREAGVEAIVNMSQISAREDARSHAAGDHWVAERCSTGRGWPAVGRIQGVVLPAAHPRGGAGRPRSGRTGHNSRPS
jgi:hypothetical protein